MLNATAYQGKTRGDVGSQTVILATQPRKLRRCRRFQVFKGKNLLWAAFLSPFGRGSCAEPLLEAVRGVTANLCRSTGAGGVVFTATEEGVKTGMAGSSVDLPLCVRRSLGKHILELHQCTIL